MRAIRSTAADATAELGQTVDLLARAPSSAAGGLVGTGIDELVDGARSAGLDVHVETDADVMVCLGDDVRAAVLRVIREGLTNALRHASVPQARVAVHVRDAVVIVRLDNPVRTGGAADPETAHAAAGPGRRGGPGRGLAGLGYRIGLLGGTLTTSTDAGVFTLEVHLSIDARRGDPSGVAAIASGAEERRRIAVRHRNARLVAFWAPIGVLAATLATLATVFVAVTVVSVLPRADVERIRIGQDRVEAERILPPVEMLEAPRGALPVVPGAECRYHEVTASFFARDDVHRVCFADGRVVAVDRIPAA